MQRGTLEKSPSDKDYKQTLEFVKQLKPLKDRYKTEMLKNKLAALSTSPVKKSLPNLKAKNAPYHVDYSAYQKVFEPGEKSQSKDMKPKRSFIASLETSHVIETESVNSSMISAIPTKYNLLSPKPLLSPLKSPKSTRPEDYVIEPVDKFKLEILNMLPVRSVDFSSAKSSSLMSSPEKKKSVVSNNEIKHSRLKGVLSKKSSTSQIQISPSSSFLGSNLFHLSQIDFESPTTDVTASQVPSKNRPVLKKLQKNPAGEDIGSVHTRMRSLHISPKAVLDTGIEEDYEEEQKYKEMDFVNNFVYGFSRWQTQEKQKIWKKCRIMDYNPKTKKFLIEWEGTQTTKEVFRRNLIFETESPRDYHAKMEVDFQKRVDAFTNIHFRGVLQSQARKRDEVLFPKHFLLGIMKRFENMNQKLLKKGIKPNVQPFLDEVYQTFKYSGELCVYNANHDPKKLSLEAVLNKMKLYHIGKTLYTELKVIYTTDPNMKDKLEANGTQIIKIDQVQRYDLILDTETFTTKLNTFEKIFIHKEAQVQKDIFHFSLETLSEDQAPQMGQLIYCLTKPVSFSKVLSTLKNKKFQTMFNPQIKESLPLYSDFIKTINFMNGLENIELFEPFYGKNTLKQKQWIDAAKELNECVERMDIQVYRVEKQLKEFLDNVRLSTYHRKEIEQRGREIETIVKCANIKIEEEIIKGTKASFSKLLNHLNSFSASLHYKMKLANNQRVFPKFTDNITAHKDALLSNLRNLKIKLHNKSLAIDGREINLKGAKKRVLFETKLGVKKIQGKSDELKKHAEARFLYRKKQRNLFYNGADTQNLENLLLNYLSIKDETMKIDYHEFTKDLMYNEITKDTLEWSMPNKKCIFKYKPSLEEIETFMKKSTTEALSKILGFQKINYFLDAESSSQAKPTHFKLTGIETDVGNFSDEINNILLNSFYKPLAFTILIEPFRFYPRDLDYFERDIKEFLNTGAFEKVMDELHALQLDLKVCKLLLPDFIESGIMIAQITDVKSILEDLIEKFSEKLINKSLDIFVNVIHETEKLYAKAWETMKPQNKDIETYIKLYDYVRGNEYKKILEDIEKRVIKALKIYEILEEALYHVDFDLLTRFYQMRMSSGELKANSDRLLKTLQGNKAKYEEQLNREKAQLEKDFEEFFEQLDSFENFDDVYKYFCEDVRGRVGTHEFAELIKKTEKMNTYREKLELEQKDMKEMFECFNLWEYCENLFNTLQSWENSFIKEINLEDMKKNFERKDEVIPKAYEFFTSENYPDINEFIQSIEDQIVIFEEYYYLVSLLKNEAFNDRYWDKLIQVIWKEVQDEFKLPRQKDLIFKNLLAKDLLSHKQTIIDLFQEASQERTLDLELSILAESMREIPFIFYKLGTYGKAEIILIENIVPIREKLEELKRSCNKYQDLSKNFKQVLDKMQRISITVDVLLKFFEELENMQNALSKSFSFIGNNEFLETLDKESRLHLQKTVLSIEEALRLLKANGFEDLIQICENIINKDVRKKGRDLAEFAKSLEKVFRFGEKKIVLQNLNQNILQSLDTHRKKHPRLYLLQDYVVAEMVSNEINPVKYLKLAQKAFDNLKEFKLTQDLEQTAQNDSDRSDVEGLVNCHGETFALPKSFQVIKGPGVGFISELEKQVKFLIQLDLFKAWKEQAAYRGNPAPLLKMFLRKEISSQSMFLSNEASFFFDLGVILQLCTRSQFRSEEPLHPRDFFKKLIQTKNLFIQEILANLKRTENDEEIFQLTCKLRLIQQEKHFIDILTALGHQESLDDLKFEYLSLPKLIINSPQTTYAYDALLKTSLESENLGQNQYGFLNGKILNLGEVESFSSKLQVFFECVDAKINYGFELADQNSEYYLYPLTDHYLYQIATSLSSQTFPLLYNTNSPALTLQIQRIASHFGKKTETIDFCELQKSPENSNIFNKLAGIMAIGGWLIMPSFENCDLAEFSQLAEYMHFIKEAVVTSKKEVILNSKAYSLNANFCILGLASSTFNDPTSLSCSLLEHYRPVHLEIPSFEHILENLIYCFGDSQLIVSNIGATMRAILAHDEFEQDQHSRDLICVQLLSKIQHIIVQIKSLGEGANNTSLQQEIVQVIRSFFEKRNHSTRFMEDLEDFFAVYMGTKDDEGTTDRSFGDGAMKDLANKALDEFISMIGGNVDEELQDHIKELFATSPTKKSMLLYGDMEEDVWLVIRAWCYIYASIQKYNFNLLRLPLDAMDSELLFGNYPTSTSGNTQFHLHPIIIQKGILEFLNKIIVANNEQTNPLSRFCKYPAIPASDNTNHYNFTNSFTTVIFDSNHLEENTLDSELTKTIINSQKNIFEVSSSNLAVFYKLKDLHHLDLTHISTLTLSYVPKKPFSIRSEHVKWLNTLNEINTWFSGTFEELENLKNFILYPLFNKFILRNKTNLSFDDRSLFKIFTEYLQIFLNELRKYAILTHPYNPFGKSHPPSITPETTSVKQFATPAMNSSRRSSRRASGLYTQHVDTVMNSEKVLTLVKQMETIRQLQDMTEDHQMTNRSSISKKMSVYKKESRILEDLQCVYIQSLTLSIGSLLKDKYKQEFEDFLIKQLQVYSQSSGKSVARSLLTKLEEFGYELSLLNCYYDFAGSQWLLFSDYNPLIKNTITPSFTSQEFSPNEKARFLMQYKETVKNQEFTCPDHLFLTSIKKKTCFILDHLISYDQNVLFIASSQQGKSVFLDYFTQFFDSYKLVINNQTSKSQLANKLSTDFKKISQASTQLIYIDDVHLQDEKLNPAGVLRSVLQLKGVYNHKETRFIPTPNLKFLLSTSFSSQAVLRSNFVKYFKYQGGPIPFYMHSEDSSDLTSIFTENTIQKLSNQSESSPISSFSEGLFEYFTQTKSALLRINNRFETNLTYPAIFSLLQSLTIPFSEDYSIETIEKILKTSLCTLFLGTPENLNKYSTEILSINIIPNPTQQAFSRKTSRFKSLISEQTTRREVDSLTSPLEIKRFRSKDTTKTQPPKSVSIRPFIDDSLPSTRSRRGTFHNKDSDPNQSRIGISEAGSELERFDPSYKNFIEKYLAAASSETTREMFIQETTTKKLKHFTETDLKDFNLGFYRDKASQNYLMYLVYVFQTFSSNLHFLALPHKNPLVVPLTQCISEVIPLINGVCCSPTDYSQDQIEKILCEMSTKSTQTHYLLVDFKNFSNPNALREFLQNLNSLVQGESIFSLLGSPRASKIIATWRSSSASQDDLTDIQTLKLIQKEIKSRFRLVLIPYDLESLTLDELKQNFPNLFSHIFYITDLIHVEQNSSSEELDSITNKLLSIEAKLEKEASLKIATKLDYQKKLVLFEMISSLKNSYMQPKGYLDTHTMKTRKLNNSQDFDSSIFEQSPASSDILLKCCFKLKEKSLDLKDSAFEQLLPKIISFAGLSSVFTSQYPQHIKTNALDLLKKDLELDITISSLNLAVIFKNEKFYHKLYLQLSNTLFASDQLCDDLMSMHLLMNHTQLPAIYAYDPLGIISLPLLSLVTGQSIVEISKDDVKAFDFTQSGVLVLKDITEEEYLIHIHETLKNLNKEYLEKLYNAKNPPLPEQNRVKFIFLFSSKKLDFFDKFDTLVLGIDLDISQADQASYKKCVENMLIYQKDQPYITEKIKHSDLEVFNLEENLLKIVNDCLSSLGENAQDEQINNFLKNKLQKTFEEITKKSQTNINKAEEEEKTEDPKNQAAITIQIKDSKKKELIDITTESIIEHDLIFNHLPKLKKNLKEWSNLPEYLLLFKQIFDEIIKPNKIPELAYLSLLRDTFIETLKESPESHLKVLHFEVLQNILKTACQWIPKESSQLVQSMLKILTQLKTSHNDYEIFWSSFMKDKATTLYKYKFSNSKISNIYEKLESFISLEGLHWRPIQQILELYASDKANLQNIQNEGRKSPSDGHDVHHRLESEDVVSSSHVLTDPYLSIQDTQDQQHQKISSVSSPLQKQTVPGISPKGSVFNKAVNNVMIAQRLTNKRKSGKIDIPVSPQGRRGTLSNAITSPINALNQKIQSPKTKVNTLQGIKDLTSSNLKLSSGALINDFSFSNVLNKPKGTPVTVPAIIDKSPATRKVRAETSAALEQYYNQYFSGVTHPAFKILTQKLSSAMTGVFIALENAKSFDLKQFFLQDSLLLDQNQSLIYDQISPLVFLFLVRALRPDLLQTFCNDFPANVIDKESLIIGKSLEIILLQNLSLSIAVMNNSEVPRLQEALQLLLQLSKIKITTFLPKNYNQDTFISAMNLLRCIFINETLPANKVIEAIDIISSILNKEKKPARVITFINQNHRSEIYERLSKINPYFITPLNSIKEFMTSLYLPEILQSFLKPLDSATSGPASKDNTGRSKNFISASILMDDLSTNGFQELDPKVIDKNQFTLYLLMSIYYFRQKLLSDGGQVTLAEIHQMGKKLVKLSQAIPGDILLAKLSQRSFGSKSSNILQHYVKKLVLLQSSTQIQIQTQEGTLENIDNVKSSTIQNLLNSLLKTYPLIAGKNPNHALQPSDILAVLTKYPDEDLIDVLEIGASNKTLFNLERSEKYSLQLQKVYKGIQDTTQNLQSLKEDFTNLWNSSSNSLLKGSHEGYKKNLTFIKGLYQVINNIDEISTRFEIDQDIKREHEDQRHRTSLFRGTLEKLQIDSLVLKGKEISKPSLFQGTQRFTEIERPVVLSDQTFEEKWIRKYVKEEIKKFNKLVERVKKDLLCITANLQENSQNENWSQLLKIIMENQVPEKWASKTTMSSYAKGLTGFLEVLIQRYEYFDLITKKFKQVQSEPSSNSSAEDISKRSLDIDKFSDPTEIILDYLTSYCIENDLEFKDIEVHLLAHKEEWVPEEAQYQPTDGIYLKGLKINHGNYNISTNQLQEASPLQILQLLPDFRLSIKTKQESEPSPLGEINLFVNTESKTLQSALLKKEAEKFDLGKIEEMLEEEEENDKEIAIEVESKIKIDFRTGKQDASLLQKSKLVFWFNSKTSQEVWACKATHIGI